MTSSFTITPEASFRARTWSKIRKQRAKAACWGHGRSSEVPFAPLATPQHQTPPPRPAPVPEPSLPRGRAGGQVAGEQRGRSAHLGGHIPVKMAVSGPGPRSPPRGPAGCAPALPGGCQLRLQRWLGLPLGGAVGRRRGGRAAVSAGHALEECLQ